MSHDVITHPTFRSQRVLATSQRQSKSGLHSFHVNLGQGDRTVGSIRHALSAKWPTSRKSILPGPQNHRGSLVCQASLRGVSRSGKNEKERTDGEAQIAEMLEAGNKAAMEGIGYKTETTSRPVSLTLHGIVESADVARLEEQLLGMAGIESLWLGSPSQGGLRGGRITVHLDLDRSVSLVHLVQWVHALDNRILALPYENRGWTWRGHKMNYGVAGQGSPVVLVHGFGGSSGHFRHLIAHLADSHRVYSLDLLGFGESEKPAGEEYSPHLWGDSVVDFVMEVVGEAAVVVGNSIGSLTALNAAVKGGDDIVSALMLMNVSGSMNRKGLAQDDWLLALLTPVFYALETLLKQPRVATYLFNGFRSKENVRNILLQQVYRDKTAVDDKLVDILYEPSTAPGAVNVFVKVFTGDGSPRPEELVENISIPMLVLWGDKDPWTPVDGKLATYFRRLATSRSNVNFFSLSDVGHCPHDDRVELAAVHFLPWLASLRK